MIQWQATTSDSKEAKSDAEKMYLHQSCMLAVAYCTTVASGVFSGGGGAFQRPPPLRAGTFFSRCGW
jgi:hypothetical protein